MVLLAAYEIALYWLSGQTDFAIACPIANRHRTETERLIGFFVNTLVMRARVEREMTRGELLCQVRDTALGAYAHQDAPFEWVVRELRPERSLDVNPLCRVLFVLQNVPDGSLCLDGVAVEPVALETQTTRFDVELIITIQAGVVSGRFVYSLALFTPSTAERMLRTYVTAVTGLVEASTRTVSDIERALSSERIASTQAGSDELQRVAMAMLASVLRARS
jgi:non-ribosomal peptide synthetase component F